MSKGPRLRVTILVEDQRLQRFVRETLSELGFSRRELRVLPYPVGQGSGKQWVTRQYPVLVKDHRAKNYQTHIALLVGTEADELLVSQRHQELSLALEQAGLLPRSAEEKVVLWVPKWNVETWILHHQSIAVDEETDHKKKVKEPIPFQDIAAAFVREFRESRKADTDLDTLPSLRLAYRETTRFIP